MEFFEGIPLESFIKSLQEPLNESKLVRILSQLFDCLSYYPVIAVYFISKLFSLGSSIVCVNFRSPTGQLQLASLGGSQSFFLFCQTTSPPWLSPRLLALSHLAAARNIVSMTIRCPWSLQVRSAGISQLRPRRTRSPGGTSRSRSQKPWAKGWKAIVVGSEGLPPSKTNYCCRSCRSRQQRQQCGRTCPN